MRCGVTEVGRLRVSDIAGVYLMTAVGSFNAGTMKKILDKAGHLSTNDEEALVAVRTASALCAKKGMTLGDIALQANNASYTELLNTPVPRFLEQIKSLQKDKEEKEKELNLLRAQVRDLQKAPKKEAKPTGPQPDADGFYSWNDFREAIIAVSGRAHGYQAFYEQMTGTSHATIQNVWRPQQKVPAEAFLIIAKLDTAKFVSATRQPWSETEYDRLCVLANEGKTDNQLAILLSLEFGRVISHNSIAGAKNRMRQKGKLGFAKA